MKITYHMDCGCTLTSDTIAKMKVSHRNTCPDHSGAYVTKRERQCKTGKCTGIATMGPMGKMPEHCDKCRHERQKARQLRAYHKRKNRPVKKEIPADLLWKQAQASVDRAFCIHRSECLAKITRSGRPVDCLPCHGCKRYSVTTVDFMDSTYRGSFCDRMGA